LEDFDPGAINDDFRWINEVSFPGIIFSGKSGVYLLSKTASKQFKNQPPKFFLIKFEVQLMLPYEMENYLLCVFVASDNRIL
jgi:hypothetical protein